MHPQNRPSQTNTPPSTQNRGEQYMKIKGGRTCLYFSPLRWQRVFFPPPFHYRARFSPHALPPRISGSCPAKAPAPGEGYPGTLLLVYAQAPPYPPYVHIRPNSKPIIRAARAQGIVLYAMKLLPGLKPGVSSSSKSQLRLILPATNK